MLFLVPTPIGNLGDMTIRAIETLKDVDLILAEDTRITGKLKKHFSIETPLSSFHAHNEHQKIEGVIQELSNGANYALVTDAGTPCISDPGFLLVKSCHEKDIPVTCLPGPSALTTAIAMSGISSDRFHFEGFLPAKKGRQTRLKYLSTLESSIVLYESPHRLLKTLKSLMEWFEESRTVSVIKEISKLHEKVFYGKLEDVIQEIEELPTVKGEFVVILEKR